MIPVMAVKPPRVMAAPTNRLPVLATAWSSRARRSARRDTRKGQPGVARCEVEHRRPFSELVKRLTGCGERMNRGWGPASPRSSRQNPLVPLNNPAIDRLLLPMAMDDGLRTSCSLGDHLPRDLPCQPRLPEPVNAERCQSGVRARSSRRSAPLSAFEPPRSAGRRPGAGSLMLPINKAPSQRASYGGLRPRRFSPYLSKPAASLTADGRFKAVATLATKPGAMAWLRPPDATP